MTRALLIDDEKPARTDLRALLAAHPQIEIVGEAALLDDARDLLTRGGYDIVFLDIQLLGGTGFDLVPHVHPEARIIFVTAYDQYALRAFEVNALDYLQKPVNVARLAETLRRIGAPARSAPTAGVAIDDLVSVKTGPGTQRFLRVAEIVAVSSADNYSTVWLASGEHFMIRQTLSAWEDRLPASHFLRVHRQNIVNVSCIAGFNHLDPDTTELTLTPLRTPFRARRSHWPELVTRLAAFGIRL